MMGSNEPRNLYLVAGIIIFSMKKIIFIVAILLAAATGHAQIVGSLKIPLDGPVPYQFIITVNLYNSPRTLMASEKVIQTVNKPYVDVDFTGYGIPMAGLTSPYVELVSPTNEEGPVGRRVAASGEGVYLVGFECPDVPGSVERLKTQGARVDHRADKDVAWVHPQVAHGLFVELRKRESYSA